MRILPRLRENLYAAVPLQTGRARAPTCLFCVRVCVAGASLDLSCGASCGTPAVGIVQTALCATRQTKTKTRWEGVRHAHTHATRHARVSCVFVRGVYFDRPSPTAASAGKTWHTRVSSPPHYLSPSERKKRVGWAPCVVFLLAQSVSGFLRRGHLKPVSKGSQRTHLSLSLLLRGRETRVWATRTKVIKR